MNLRYVAHAALYVLAVLAIALATTWATTALPFHTPAAGQPVCIAVGVCAMWLALRWLPTPQRPKKDGRR